MPAPRRVPGVAARHVAGCQQAEASPLGWGSRDLLAQGVRVKGGERV